MSLTRDFFIALSQNRLLNKSAKRWGLRLGASKVVAGTDTESAIQTIQKLNDKGISCTLDNLGEFVFEKEEALAAKENIIKTRSEEHTSELQSRGHLVCRLLLEK